MPWQWFPEVDAAGASSALDAGPYTLHLAWCLQVLRLYAIKVASKRMRLARVARWMRAQNPMT